MNEIISCHVPPLGETIEGRRIKRTGENTDVPRFTIGLRPNEVIVS